QEGPDQGVRRGRGRPPHIWLRPCCLVGQAVPPALAGGPRSGPGRASLGRGMRNHICEIVDQAKGERNLKAEIGVIGGSGLYGMPGFESQREEAIETPFGWPSD